MQLAWPSIVMEGSASPRVLAGYTNHSEHASLASQIPNSFKRTITAIDD
jgi:hypothetical protein